MVDHDKVVDWSKLCYDVQWIIASKLNTQYDRNAFRGCCKSFRSTGTKDRFTVSRVPVLMLPEIKNSKLPRERTFYSLDKNKIYMRQVVPGAEGKRCIGIGFGWILVLATSGEACMLKPFSPARIDLPSYFEFPLYEEYSTNPPPLFITQAVLTHDPSETDEFTLLVVVNGSLGLWKYSDKKWVGIESQAKNMVYFRDRMYSFVSSGESQIEIWNPQAIDFSVPEERVPLNNVPTVLGAFWLTGFHLVKSAERLLLIVRVNGVEDDGFVGSLLDYFVVVNVDVGQGICERINSLGNDAIFVGDSAPVSIDVTEFPGLLRPNCIYYTDDCRIERGDGVIEVGGGKDMGIFNLATNEIERFGVEAFCRVSPPIWIFPSF